MPSRMNKAKNLVARPDRVDFRDRPYLPPLTSLPAQWPHTELVQEHLDDYVKNGLILDQGEEGACTGFGLAAVINYIFWRNHRQRAPANRLLLDKNVEDLRPLRVSSHMLYTNAKIYDEWEGEDYEGSSCRGAMKGWHKHGVCAEESWNPDIGLQADGWQIDAALRPVGAYYRIDAKSIADMQAAIFETGSIYCSADVHAGWDRPRSKANLGSMFISRIDYKPKKEGGHAFSLVGYTDEGFIVQNSWNKDWGSNGFALLTYEDWIQNGFDAWAAALGAPMQGKAPATAGRNSLISLALQSHTTVKSGSSAQPVPPWSEERAYLHAVIMGNDGKLLNRIVGAVKATDALDRVLVQEIEKSKHSHVAIYVHGGLNEEDSAIDRARRLGPWFEANGIHPVFLIWRTGVMESLLGIAGDELEKFEKQEKALRAKGWGSAVEAALNALAEAKDRAFEAAAEKLIGKAVWTQMKQNAAMAASGTEPLAAILTRLKAHANKCTFHLLGHSAGAIMIGHLLDVAGQPSAKLNFKTCGLFAPACRLDFAAEKYGKAMQLGGPLGKATLDVDILTDKAETADSVGKIYGKSLLYLVSRALEDHHKMPLLGLQICAKPDEAPKKPGMEIDKTLQTAAYASWTANVMKTKRATVQSFSGPKVKAASNKFIDIAHGSFDNDIAIVEASMRRMLNLKPDEKLPTPIKDLTGF
jgi:Papain family cysteine protease